MSNKIEDNICSVYGVKFLSSLTSFVIHTKSQIESSSSSSSSSGNIDTSFDSSNNNNNNDTNTNNNITIRVFVSKVGVGVGRSDNDKQFIYCNQRPVELTKFHRLFNDVSGMWDVCWQ